MDTQKVSEKSLMTASYMGVGAAAGVFAGRVLSNKTESFLANSKMRKGALIIAGAIGAAMVKGSDNTSNAVRSACVGVIADQGVALAKEFINPEADSLMAVGLGNPQEPIVIYDTNFHGLDGNGCECNEVVDTEYHEVVSMNLPSLNTEGFRLV